MTEKEVNDLTLEVLNGEEVSPEFEIAHLNAQLAALKIERDKIQCNFRMWKYVNDHERMTISHREIKKINDLIEYITRRLDELNG